MTVVGWDVSHGEFTVEDPYYYGKLRRLIEERGRLIVAYRLEELREADVIVLNYPEKHFSDQEAEFIYRLASAGKRIIALGYCNDEDGANGVISKLLRKAGIALNPDLVEGEGEEPYMLEVTDIYAFNEGVSKVVLPCTASMRLYGVARPMARYRHSIVGAMSNFFSGTFVALGTCAFWDNFSIGLADNERFALNLLSL